MDLFIQVPAALRPALLSEVAEFDVRPVPGGVMLRGGVEHLAMLNLNLRTASRVLVRLLDRQVSSNAQLERALDALDFTPYLTPKQPIVLETELSGTPWTRTDAVTRAFEERTGHPVLSSPPEEHTHARISLQLENDRFEVSIDSSGELLHRRGYRQETSMAPLRESLAAGILSELEFDGSRPFWDPMCGSGTLLVEAAWKAMRRPPGLGRSFAFEKWPSFDAAAFEAQKRALLEQQLPKPPAPIFGTDLHAGALGTARRNARRAEVLSFLSLERKDATSLSPPPGMEPGVLAANLPYGKRVGERDDLRLLYRRFFDNLLAQFRGWRVGLLVPEGAGVHFAAKPELTVFLSNGGIPVELLGYDLPSR